MKKLGVLLLVLSLLMNLVACGNTTEGEDATGSSNETKTEAGASESKESTPLETQSDDVSTSDDPVKIIMREVNTGGSEATDNQMVYDYIVGETGIDFEITNMPSSDELGKKINLTLAGMEDVDAVQTSYSTASMADLQARGALMPLRDLIMEHTPDLYDAFTEDQWKSVSDLDGEIWAIPRLQEDMGLAIAIRKDWREELGIEKAPTTIEEFEEYLIAVRDADLNGNGELDTIPLLSIAGFKELEGALGYIIMGVTVPTSRTAFCNYIDDDGNVVPIALHPRYKVYTETIARWYEEGLLHPDQYLLQKDQANDLIIGNRVAAHAGWYSRFIRPWETLTENDPDAEYEYIALETYDGGDYKVTRGYEANPGMSIVSYSDNAVNTLKLFEWLVLNEENFITSKYGLEGVHWEYEDKDNLIINDLSPGEGIYDSAYQIMYYANYFPTISNIGDEFVAGNYNKAQVFMKEQGYIWREDYNIFYDITDTPFENTKADADTFLEESTLSIILGETSIDEWDSIMDYYKELYADEFTIYATELFNQQK